MSMTGRDTGRKGWASYCTRYVRREKMKMRERVSTHLCTLPSFPPSLLPSFNQ
jgi:hypothetical protein